MPPRSTSSAEENTGSAGRVFAVFLCGTFAFLELYCTQPLLPLLARVFHASETSASATISASTVGVAVSAALLAVFGERLDRKRTIVLAMAALAVVVALTATAPSLAALARWRLMQGLLTPGIFIISIAYITEEWPAAVVPRVMSVYVAGTVFGGFLGRVAGGTMAERWGWRPMFVVLGVAGALGAVLTQILLRPAQPRPVRVRSGEGVLAPVWRNLRSPRLLATFLIGFCMLFTLVSVFSYITFYLSDAPFRLSTEALSWLFAVYLFGLFATLAAGKVLVRIGLRHGMVAAAAIAFAGTALTLVPLLAVIAVGLALVGCGVFIAQTCANSFLRDAAPEGGRVAAAGMYICSYYIGGTVGGILPGLLWRYGRWPGSVALVCGMLVVAAATAFFGWRERPAGLDPIPL